MMSSLAEQALEHARLRLAGRHGKRPTSTGAKIINAPQEVSVRSLDVVVDGPINHFMFLEGRAWALELVKSLRASSLDQVITRLAGAAQNRPGSYAAGIKSIADALLSVGNDASDSSKQEYLTNQGV
jgi:hypothetical protein